MKVTISDLEIELSKEMVGHLRSFAVGVMDAMRAAHPDTAWCWNACRIWFDDDQPQFAYAENIECTHETDLPHIDVVHANPIVCPRPAKKGKA